MTINLSKGNLIRRLPSPFISIAIDSSQIIGGYWWEGACQTIRGLGATRIPPLNLKNKLLINSARHLGAKYLRIGGTEADKIFYHLKKRKKNPPDGYDYIINRNRWKEVVQFTREINSKLMITLNAGAGPRKDKKNWKKKNANHLIKYANTMACDADLWELGNEVNAFIFFHGLKGYISPRQYAKDMQKLAKTLKKSHCGKTAGPAVAVWPIIGEILPFLKSFLRHAEESIDVITWHYYPQQSFRSPITIRRARKKTLLNPRHLDEFIKRANKIAILKEKYAPKAKLWVGETGHAQCGGEPGLSDTFISGFWWLDQLGASALHHQDQVVRQTLVGGDYGLLDYRDMTPLPDYWSTILWNKLVGPKVYQLHSTGTSKLRIYLHSRKKRKGYCLIFINLEQKNEIKMTWDNSIPTCETLYLLHSDTVTSKNIYLNGHRLRFRKGGILPKLKGKPIKKQRELIIPPGTYGFLLLGTH